MTRIPYRNANFEATYGVRIQVANMCSLSDPFRNGMNALHLHTLGVVSSTILSEVCNMEEEETADSFLCRCPPFFYNSSNNRFTVICE